MELQVLLQSESTNINAWKDTSVRNEEFINKEFFVVFDTIFACLCIHICTFTLRKYLQFYTTE